MPFAKPAITADEKPDAKIAAGIVFVAPDGDVLLLRRSAAEKNFGGHWGLPGGGGEAGESAKDAAMREFKEECGLDIDMGATLKLLDRVDTPTGMQFSTFAKPAEDKFVPTLDAEHSGYCWASLDQLPRPLHPQVERLLSSHIGAVADMTPEDWAGLREGFTKWTREEEAEPEHADDAVRAMDMRLAMDRATFERHGRPGNDLIALDRSPSVRSYDADGKMRVSLAHMSKANVCPYWGHEIPDFEALGLEPDRKYQLLRHPDELRKAAPTLNNQQVMLGHVPVNADDHKPEMWVGTTGTDAKWNDPYLDNSLTIHAREGIDAIESGEAKELSCGYRYKPVMTPGTFKGVPYDGVMTEIGFNHVALVPEGRAGADIVVGDSQFTGQTKEILMSKKVLSRFGGASALALSMHLLPKLAADAKIDISPMFEGVTKKNFASKKAKIAQDVKAAAAGKLAKDANLDDMHEFMDRLDKADVAEGADEDPSSGLPMNEAELKAKAKDEAEAAAKKKAEDRAAKDAELKNFLKGKLSSEDMKACDEMMGEEAEDESEEAEENAEGKEGAGAAKPAKDKTVDAKAMDAAIKTAVANERKNNRETQQAYADVEPFVGKLALGMDSAAEVYKTALKGLGMDAAEVDALHPSALKAVLKAQNKPGEKNRTTFATDGALDASSFDKRWGDTVGRLGAA
jgi:8-oxo-dGTP pyrophosphatase MutT (NUDIX family)